VDFDGDLAFIVATICVHLSSASVLTVVIRGDVADPKPVRHVDLISAVFCNTQPKHYIRAPATTYFTPRGNHANPVTRDILILFSLQKFFLTPSTCKVH